VAKDWKLYALHVLQDRGDITKDFVLYDATLRNLQILSESTAHFPDELKLQYPQINWKGINGFRNILVHDYLGDIDPQTVNNIISNYILELEIAVKKILNISEPH
jgi:uncharacterized protein with HEPN domain